MVETREDIAVTKLVLLDAQQMSTRQSEMADLARRATSVCTKFHRDRLRND